MTVTVPSRVPITGRPIRFALVGCGRISANHIEALQQHSARADQDRVVRALRAALS